MCIYRCVSTNENILEYDKKSMELQNNTKVDNEQEFWPSQEHNEGKQKVCHCLIIVMYFH